jgi:phage-related protein (TIGR01555 family)
MKNVRKTQPKVPAHKQNMVQVNDGFANVAARMGYSPGQVSNLMSQGTFQTTLLTRNRLKLDAAYRGNWVVGIVVDAVADDMTAAGISITGEADPKKVAKIQKKLTDLGVWNALNESKKWARLYGGAIGVVQIRGQSLETELRIETIGKDQFTGITVYDRHTVTPSMMDLIPDGPDMGLPKYYDIILQGGVFIRVHHTRVIRDIGIKLPYYESLMENHWGESVIERMEDRLMSFDTGTAGAANLVNKAYLRTISVEGLRTILAAGGVMEENLIKMFQYVRLLQSSEGLTIIDKNDQFQTAAYSFAGLSDVINQMGEQLAGATGIPLVRLFGQSPAGFNGGDTDLRNYQSMINREQESRMRPGMAKILAIMYHSLFGADVPEDFDFTFNPLYQLTDEQKSTIAKTNGETIKGYVDAGIFDTPTAMKEVKQQSIVTGIGSNITDEMIQEAIDNPPLPVETEQNPDEILGLENEQAQKSPLQKAIDAMYKVIGRGK